MPAIELVLCANLAPATLQKPVTKHECFAFHDMIKTAVFCARIEL